jgi:hypothetical protein
LFALLSNHKKNKGQRFEVTAPARLVFQKVLFEFMKSPRMPAIPYINIFE